MIKETIIFLIVTIVYMIGLTWLTSYQGKVYIEFKDRIESVTYNEYFSNSSWIDSTYKNEPYINASKPVYNTVGKLEIVCCLLFFMGACRLILPNYIKKRVNKKLNGRGYSR